MVSGRVEFEPGVEPLRDPVTGEQAFRATINGRPIRVVANKQAMLAAKIVAAGTTHGGYAMTTIEALEEAATRWFWKNRMPIDTTIRLTMADLV